MNRKKLKIAAATVVLLGGAYAGYRRWSAEAEEPQGDEKAEFDRRRMDVRSEATAVVEPRNRIEIKPPLGGRMEEVSVVEGQSVKRGDIVALMSSSERATLLDAARAKGDAEYRKWSDVYKPTPLVAPLDGTIIARKTEPGQTVTAQDAVLTLSDRLIVAASVDETDIGRVRLGQSVRIALDAHPETDIAGTVSHIAFEAGTVNNVTVYKVTIEPVTVPPAMRSGMTATASFLIAEADDALTLPADAVTVEDGKSSVRVAAGEGGAVERRRVLTGLAAGGRIEILAGLDGSEIVLRRSFSVAERKEAGASPFMPARRR